MRQDTAPQLAILFDGTRAHAVYTCQQSQFLADWQHQQVNRTAHPLFPVALAQPTISSMSMRIVLLCTCTRWAPPPASDPIPLASLPLPLVARRTGEKRMCSPVPANAASLRETGSVARYTTAWASCNAMCSINALADGAEGLHFSGF